MLAVILHEIVFFFCSIQKPLQKDTIGQNVDTHWPYSSYFYLVYLQHNYTSASGNIAEEGMEMLKTVKERNQNIWWDTVPSKNKTRNKTKQK